jgi:tol-pal system protein YbgF
MKTKLLQASAAVLSVVLVLSGAPLRAQEAASAAQAKPPGASGNAPSAVAANPGLLDLLTQVQALRDEVARLRGQGEEIAQLRAQLAERDAHWQAQMKNAGALNLLGQVEGLRADLARLHGVQEEMSHAQKQVEDRQKALYGDLEDRLKKQAEAHADQENRLQELANRALTPREVMRLQPSQSLFGGAATEMESETKVYEAALGQFRAGDYAAAVEAFQGFLQRHPGGPLAGNAYYWLGLAYFSQGDFKNAAAAQLRLQREFPQSQKVPDSMVNLARAQIQLGEPELARNLLEQVLEKYPVTRAAEVARKMHQTLK